MKGIVVPPLKLVYWFIPKNACTTMKVYFATLLGLDFTNPHRAKFEYTTESLEGFTDVAIVRNPYARLWSLYNNWDDVHSRTVYGKYKDAFWKGMDWNSYVDAIINTKHPDRHFIPQNRLVPESAKIEKMEDSVLLRFFGKHNSTGVTDFPKDERIYNYYKEDFERFGYES